MKAISVTPDHQVRLVERPAPALRADNDVLLRVLRVGICGTDREEVRDSEIRPAAGYDDLVIGHEMVARVEQTGSGVTTVKAGDFAVCTVRRGCGECAPCRLGRADMCSTGKYLERGIRGLDGFQCERVVENSSNIVPVPNALGADAVLAEPLSIVEKAIHELERLQIARLPDASAAGEWLTDRRCLVAGLGPVGLLAAMVLRLRGAVVFGLDAVDEQTARPEWLRSIGGTYLDGRNIQPDAIDDAVGAMSVIVEATGAPKLAFSLIDALSWNGAYVLTGLPSGHATTALPAADLMSEMVLHNQLLLGSVNASHDHFLMAVQDLTDAAQRWPGCLSRLITHRYPTDDFKTPLLQHEPDEIKTVIEWSE